MSGSAWTKLEQRFFAKYHGVEGGVLLKGPFWQNLAQKYPVFGKVNNGTAQSLFESPLPLIPPPQSSLTDAALWAAPAFKWGMHPLKRLFDILL
jgi:hypothetical protein